MWAWLLLGLAVLLAAGAVVAAVVLAGGAEDAAVVNPPTAEAGEPAVVNPHTAEAGEPALISVPGYAYEDLTGDDLAFYKEALVPNYKTTNDEFRENNPELGDFYLGWSGHIARAANGELVLLYLASVNQDYLDAGVFTEEDLALGRSASEDPPNDSLVMTYTIAGEEVVHVSAPDSFAYRWFHDGAETVLSGSNREAARDFVEAYLEVANQ